MKSQRGVGLINLYVFLSALLLIVMSFYFQYAQEMEPCPLCIMQRLALIMIALFALWGMALRSKNWLLLNFGLQLVISLLGLFFASRQVWLQHLPLDKIPACGPGLNYLIHYFPLQQVLKILFEGSGECAKDIATFAGLTLPQWMMLWFGVFVLANLYGIKRATGTLKPESL